MGLGRFVHELSALVIDILEALNQLARILVSHPESFETPCNFLRISGLLRQQTRRLTLVAREEANGSLDGMQRRTYQVDACAAYASILRKGAQEQLDIRKGGNQSIEPF